MSGENGAVVPTEQEFRLFQRMILQRLGIHLPDQKRALVSNRLWKRLQARQVTCFQDYYDLINRADESDELNQALELITTNETYFFREPRHFDFLREQILPALRARTKLRIWSAACSSGQEIYSIAMVLDQLHNGPWELLGSDVNQTMLERARMAIYPDERTELMPVEFRRRYCRKGTGPHTGRLRIVPELRRQVTLRQIRLHQPLPDIGTFDVIFLRNVMIYFDDATRRDVVQRISELLNPDGYLVVGHSESLHGVAMELQAVIPSIYQRRVVAEKRGASVHERR